MKNESSLHLISLFRIGLILLCAGMVLYLGMQPLYREEPRRALIAMELVANENWWFPTQLGLPYFKKPPLYNWMLIIAAKIWGSFDEFPLRMVTVLSTLGIAGILGYFTKKYIHAIAGWAAACLLIGSIGLLFDFSTLAEIDLFYSFLVVASFGSIFHFTQKKQWAWLFLFAYLFTALGVLTKGLPSFVFLGLSLPAYLIYKGHWKKLFHPAHFLGIGLGLLIIGGYLWKYQQFYPLEELLSKMWSESSDRTAAENSIGKLLTHLFVFPSELLVNLLPGSFLMVFLFQKGVRKALFQNEWAAFCLIMFAVNIPIYWISPGARMRYVYMLFPLLICIFCWGYYSLPHLNWQRRSLQILVWVVLGACMIGALGINWVEPLQFLPHLWIISLVGILAFGFLLFLYWKLPKQTIPILILGLGIARILFDLTIMPQRAHDSKGQVEKELGIRIHQESLGNPLYIHTGDSIAYTSVYYIDLNRGNEVLRSKDQPAPGDFFIQDITRGALDAKKIFEFDSVEDRYALWYIPEEE